MNKNELSREEDVLRLSGGVMIGFGIVRIVLSTLLLLALLGLDYLTGGIFRTLPHLLGAALLLASAVAEVIAGSLGVKCARRRAGSTVCLVFGALCLVLSSAAVVLNLRSFPLRITVGLALGLVVPVVYLLAALKCPGKGAGTTEAETAAAPEEAETAAETEPAEEAADSEETEAASEAEAPAEAD